MVFQTPLLLSVTTLAMKCNPNEVILDLMATLPNICFDCASPGEIVEILNRGISPRHIIYANTIKVR